MTHAELVQRAAKWLEKEHAVVVTEMASGALCEPDAIGFKAHWTTMIECKVSRADFLANKRKPQRQMGAYRYFMTPPGLLASLHELPDPRWGLLEVGKNVRTIKEAEQFYDEDRDIRGELSILVSCLRRIGQQPRPECVSVKCYTYQTKNRATLGIGEEA